MKKIINVLVFPAGEINSIELHSALSSCVNVRVFGASSIERHGSFVFEKYFSNFPKISDPLFLEKLNLLIKEQDIDVIFPTHDSVSLFLSEKREQINSKIIVADKETTILCRDKLLLYKKFQDYDFCPKIYESKTEVLEFPVFCKPREGQGSQGAFIAKDSDEIGQIDFNITVMTEYLPGIELTVDCFTDVDGTLKVVSPRTRDRVMAGVSVAGKTIEVDNEISLIAKTLNEQLKFSGLWFFQIKKNNGGLFKILEISTRCAGAMCLTRARGFNLPLMSVYAAMGINVNPIDYEYNVEFDRTLISRYRTNFDYDTVYLDFDDTLIINEKVNLDAVRFVYQCRNLKKRVFLITKHAFNLDESLSAYGIDKKLFEKIIHLKPEQEKHEFMVEGNAIFIDNAFSERKKVWDRLKMKSFDVDAIEVLLDWRK